MGTAAHAMVATSDSLSTRAGLEILRAGGNAVDAFVAASLTDDVVLPGVTSAAGLVGVLVYQSRTGRLFYVSGALRHSLAPGRTWQRGDTAIGKRVLLPGKVVALEEATRRFGRLPWRRDVAPAVRVANDGFALDALYANSISANRAMLSRSRYGRATFFRGEKPLARGDILKQPEMAASLARIAERGAADMVHGTWARAFVDRVRAAGGNLALADLATVKPLVVDPLHTRYRGLDVYTSWGASYGGAKAILALDAMGRHDLARLGTDDRSVPALELLLRIERGVEARSFYTDPSVLQDRSRLEADIATAAAEIAADTAVRSPPHPSRPASPHSSAVVVIDPDGNIAAGVHTIEAGNWGEGLFVGGIPLSTAAAYTPAAPDGTALDPLSPAIVLDNGKPRVALATYGSGLHPADVQLLSDVIDFGMSPEQAVLAPRAGWLYFDPLTGQLDSSRRLLDPRIPASMVCRLEEDGFDVVQEVQGYPIVDTGFGTLLTIGATGDPARLEAMTPMWMTSGLAAGY